MADPRRAAERGAFEGLLFGCGMFAVMALLVVGAWLYWGKLQ